MKLVDLHPEWVSHAGRTGEGFACDCPCGGCEAGRLWIPFSNPIDGLPKSPEISGWERTGDTFETLTVKPSIQRNGACTWHGFLTDGVFRKC